jgi:sialic acid synthase
MTKPQIQPPRAKVVAEIGCNHKGDIAIAKEMIEVAKRFCRADAVKFQKRTPRELLSPAEYAAPHPNPCHAYGPTYGEHREALEFSVEQHAELMAFAAELRIEYSTSVWDLTAARQIAALRPGFLKIPSACNTHWPLLEFLAAEYAGEIHVSVGMTTRAEETGLVDFFTQRGRAKDLVIYSCTSGYPVEDADVCLLEIERLRSAYGRTVRAIGFSGHHLGIAIDIAALALGAQWIERHFTLDRTWRGTDHAASLEPDGLRRLVRDVASVSLAMNPKTAEILPVEDVQRKKLKRQ